MTQSSESFVYLKQQVGNHEIKLGAYTIDATGVPLLLGIRTLERLGAILDTKQGYLVMKTVDPTLIVPLKRSQTGHLLLDLCSNWLDGGAKILFQTEISPTSVEEKAFSVVSFDGCWKDVEKKVEGEEVISYMSSSSTPTAPHSCANFDIVAHTFTYNSRAAVEDIFVMFDDSSLTHVHEDSVQFQNMTISSATTNMSNSSSSGSRTSMLVPPQFSEDQDQAMSLRILALLASTSLLAAHGSATAKAKSPPTDSKAATKSKAKIPWEASSTPVGRRARTPETRGVPVRPATATTRLPKVAEAARRAATPMDRGKDAKDAYFDFHYTPAYGAHALHRKSGPLPSDTTEMVAKVGPNNAGYNEKMKDRSIALDAAESSAEKKLAQVRAMKAQWQKQHKEEEKNLNSTGPSEVPPRPQTPVPQPSEEMGTTPGRKARKPDQPAENLEYDNRSNQSWSLAETPPSGTP